MIAYIIQDATKSHCGVCEGMLSLLCNDADPDTTPWFYICWHCRRVTQVGIGHVKDERKETAKLQP